MIKVTSFYTVFNGIIHNFVFIYYDNFIKIIYNKKSIILSHENFIKQKELFQIYFISLICTKNSDNVEKDMVYRTDDSQKEFVYGSLSKHYNEYYKRFDNHYSFNPLTKFSFKNPLNSKQPSRESSKRKQMKMLKVIHYDLNGFDPIEIIDDIFYR